MLATLDEARAHEDPWAGLQLFVGNLLQSQSQDRGLKQAFHESDEGRERVTRAKGMLQPILAELVEKAQAAGKLRADVTTIDILMGVMMVGAVMDATRDVSPDAWRRYMALALGRPPRRPSLGRRDSQIPALSQEQFDEALRCGKLSGRRDETVAGP